MSNLAHTLEFLTGSVEPFELPSFAGHTDPIDHCPSRRDGYRRMAVFNGHVRGQGIRISDELETREVEVLRKQRPLTDEQELAGWRVDGGRFGVEQATRRRSIELNDVDAPALGSAPYARRESDDHRVGIVGNRG